MKPYLPAHVKALFPAFFLMLPLFKLSAQDIASDPGAYMTAISNAESDMNETYLAYTSAVAHSGRARKVEKLRQKTLQHILNCKSKIAALPYFQGDNSLRKSSLNYVDICYKIFGQDYAHIVNMESLVEQSFDDMQLYLLLMEKTNDRLQQAIHSADSAEKQFAANHQVHVINEKDKLSEEMTLTSEVMDYRNDLYLLFYKCNWQDGQITEAVNNKKLTGLEESRNALDTYAKEGIGALDSLRDFKGDRTLGSTCEQALLFYQRLAEKELPKISDFYLEEANFLKMKKAFEAKPRSKLTKQEVDAYNKAVNDYNSDINAYNQLNAKINSERSQNIDQWNHADKVFMDVHIPHVRS